MSKATSYADHVTEWETLLGNVAGEEVLTGLTNPSKLQSVLDRVKTLLVQQKESQAAKQEASQQIRALIFEGKDVTRDLKAEIAGKLGARSERLVRFKVKPLRLADRPKKAKEVTQGAIAAQDAAGTASGATPSPATA